MRRDCPRCGAPLVQPKGPERLLGVYQQCGDSCGLWRLEPDLRCPLPYGPDAVEWVRAARHAEDEREYRRGFYRFAGEWFPNPRPYTEKP